jgi:hypothetical protein
MCQSEFGGGDRVQHRVSRILVTAATVLLGACTSGGESLNLGGARAPTVADAETALAAAGCPTAGGETPTGLGSNSCGVFVDSATHVTTFFPGRSDAGRDAMVQLGEASSCWSATDVAAMAVTPSGTTSGGGQWETSAGRIEVTCPA